MKINIVTEEDMRKRTRWPRFLKSLRPIGAIIFMLLALLGAFQVFGHMDTLVSWMAPVKYIVDIIVIASIVSTVLMIRDDESASEEALRREFNAGYKNGYADYYLDMKHAIQSGDTDSAFVQELLNLLEEHGYLK